MKTFLKGLNVKENFEGSKHEAESARGKAAEFAKELDHKKSEVLGTLEEGEHVVETLAEGWRETLEKAEAERKKAEETIERLKATS